MGDSIISSAKADIAKVEAAVAASEPKVLAFIQAHYAKVVYFIAGAVVLFIVKKFI